MLPPRLRRLQALLGRLPGVGEKTAQRYVFSLLASDSGAAEELGRELVELRTHVGACERCGYIAERSASGPTRCAICSDSKRDSTVLCVVGRMTDVVPIERSGAMRGRYFVLGKLLSPLEGIGPEQIQTGALRRRIADDDVREVILATPTTVDGEATALFLKRDLESLGLTVTRIASGLPHGGDLEFADPVTMGRAFSGRRGF